MILMPQIFDVTANENARYKRNELEYNISGIPEILGTNILVYFPRNNEISV